MKKTDLSLREQVVRLEGMGGCDQLSRRQNQQDLLNILNVEKKDFGMKHDLKIRAGLEKGDETQVLERGERRREMVHDKYKVFMGYSQGNVHSFTEDGGSQKKSR